MNNEDGAEKIIDFSAHFHEKLQLELAREKQQKHKIIAAFRNHKQLNEKIQKAVSAAIACDNLDAFFRFLYNDLPYFFGCDVVRLGLESDFAQPHESYYPEYSYSGLCFLPIGFCIEFFASYNISIINEENTISKLMFCDCVSLVKSSLHLPLFLPEYNRHAILSFGCKQPQYFTNSKYNPQLLNFMAEIIAIQLNKLLANQSGLI